MGTSGSTETNAQKQKEVPDEHEDPPDVNKSLPMPEHLRKAKLDSTWGDGDGGSKIGASPSPSSGTQLFVKTLYLDKTKHRHEGLLWVAVNRNQTTEGRIGIGSLLDQRSHLQHTEDQGVV
jgi:hypothetical protein